MARTRNGRVVTVHGLFVRDYLRMYFRCYAGSRCPRCDACNLVLTAYGRGHDSAPSLAAWLTVLRVACF
eukprot:365313-Chlamydomonas_euryale.AAC.43